MSRHSPVPLAALAAWMLITWTAAQAWTVERKLEFKPGTAQLRAKLKPQADADLRSLISDDFDFALADLDDDGHQKLIVTSAGACPRLGCPVQVQTVKQGRLVILLSTSLPAGLAITREKQGGYRALVVMDGQGGMALADTPRPGVTAQPMVRTIARTPAAGTAAPHRSSR